MRTIITNIFAAAAVTIMSLSLSGCNDDFLETKSTQNVDQEQMFETTAGGMMAVNGLHKLMYTPSLSSTYAQGGYQTWMIWMEMMGEDLVYTRSNAQFQSHAKWTLHRNTTSSHLSYHYQLFYRFVSNANMILENIDNAQGLPEEKENIKGQALAYRAFAYFNLVQAWGGRYVPGQTNMQPGVVLRLESSTDNMPRASVEEVYDRINKDLDEAIEHLGNVTTIKKANKSHIDIHVARGLKARVLLAQGKWKDAAAMAQKVIDGSGARLQDDTYVTTVNRMSDQSNTEWIWGKFGQEDQAGTLKDFHSFMSNKNASYNKNTPRAIYNLLYNRISDTDIRKTLWFPEAQNPKSQPRPVIPTGGQIRNYMANKFLLADENMKCGDVPWMRLPEMMLTVAEGYARAGMYAEAAQALYPLAHHRDPEYTLSTNTGDDLIDEIMFQRRIELWGEGFRFTDLKRLAMPLDRGPKPFAEAYDCTWNSSTKMPTVIDPEGSNFNMYDAHTMGEECRYREPDHKEWQFVFPKREVDVNTLCEQNPL